jgi:hypothetical protein
MRKYKTLEKNNREPLEGAEAFYEGRLSYGNFCNRFRFEHEDRELDWDPDYDRRRFFDYRDGFSKEYFLKSHEVSFLMNRSNLMSRGENTAFDSCLSDTCEDRDELRKTILELLKKDNSHYGTCGYWNRLMDIFMDIPRNISRDEFMVRIFRAIPNMNFTKAGNAMAVFHYVPLTEMSLQMCLDEVTTQGLFGEDSDHFSENDFLIGVLKNKSFSLSMMSYIANKYFDQMEVMFALAKRQDLPFFVVELLKDSPFWRVRRQLQISQKIASDNDWDECFGWEQEKLTPFWVGAFVDLDRRKLQSILKDRDPLIHHFVAAFCQNAEWLRDHGCFLLDPKIRFFLFANRFVKPPQQLPENLTEAEAAALILHPGCSVEVMNELIPYASDNQDWRRFYRKWFQGIRVSLPEIQIPLHPLFLECYALFHNLTAPEIQILMNYEFPSVGIALLFNRNADLTRDFLMDLVSEADEQQLKVIRESELHRPELTAILMLSGMLE